MLSEKMLESLNKQINAEFYSSYLYLAMAAYFEAENLDGFAHWMKKQSEEEYGHALKIYGYVNNAGGKVELQQINKPNSVWDGVPAVFEDVLKHEKEVTKMVNDLTDQAISEKDHATNIFLHWFVEEQVEEVATAEKIVDKIQLIGDAKSGLFMLDRELGRRQ